MNPSRRGFLAQSFIFIAGIPSMTPLSHVVLLGDSIFDNSSYTGGKPDVIAQVREVLPAGWKATLLARDGATTAGIESQLSRLPRDATHLVLSIGGNDALGQTQVLDFPVRSTADALLALAKVAREFEASYRKVVTACLTYDLPLLVCTIYNGNFADANYQTRAAIALSALNDAIIRIAVEKHLTVLELRQICNRPEDFANPIEPSSIGGAKIAKAIVRTITVTPDIRYGARIVGRD
ncbi:MAG: hypothetical protein JWQ23_1383 [Herminiimonas sp.]|nr:hypothetical protein [Herminiimonas sp.]